MGLLGGVFNLAQHVVKKRVIYGKPKKWLRNQFYDIFKPPNYLLNFKKLILFSKKNLTPNFFSS